MQLKKAKNEDFAGTIMKVGNIGTLKMLTKLKFTFNNNNLVLIDNAIYHGDKVIYFPVGCKLAKEYLHVNNLYRNNKLNKDKSKTGYFEKDGKVRILTIKGARSRGLIMRVSSLIGFAEIADLSTIEVGTKFDTINGFIICEKYQAKKNEKIKTNKLSKSNVTDKHSSIHANNSRKSLKGFWKKVFERIWK